MKAEIVVDRHVYDENSEQPLTVSPSGDVPKYLVIQTRDQEAEEWWGKVNITISADMARALAAALIASADEADAK